MQLLESETGMISAMLTTTEPHPFAEQRLRTKRQIAEMGLIRARLHELQAAIAGVEREIDAAEAEHTGIIEPLQAELAEIRSAQVDEIVAKTTPDAVREARRKELIALIDAANSTLATAAREGGERLESLRQEEYATREKLSLPEYNLMLLERELTDLVPEERRLELYVASNAIDWAQRRLNAANSVAAQHNDYLEAAIRDHEHPDKVETLTRRVRRLRAESAAAGRALSAARHFYDELRAAVLAE